MQNYEKINPKNINEAISILKTEINIYKTSKNIEYNDSSHLKIKEKELIDLENFKKGNLDSLLGQNFLILHNNKKLLMIEEGNIFKKSEENKDIKPLIKTSKWKPLKGAKY